MDLGKYPEKQNVIFNFFNFEKRSGLLLGEYPPPPPLPPFYSYVVFILLGLYTTTITLYPT